MSASDVMVSPEESERCDYPLTPSRDNNQGSERRCSVHRHRKAVSTGGGRAWTEEEVSKNIACGKPTGYLRAPGVLFTADTQQQDAL